MFHRRAIGCLYISAILVAGCASSVPRPTERVPTPSVPTAVAAAPPTSAAAAPSASAPSCAGLPSTCGPHRNADCCQSNLVPGGKYLRRGYAYAPATVSSFRLDTYEITIGRFRKFVEAGLGTQAHPPAPGAGKHPKLARSGWDPKDNKELPASTSELMAELHCGNIPRYDDYPSFWTDTAGSGETLPMNCLTWFEAFAFCAWDGGRLPTEAEWDYAAAGGAEQRQYPWWPAHHHEELDFAGHVNLTRPKPVGSSSPATDGKWGHSDLAGNVEEWTLDLFADYYANGPGSAHGFPVPCVDCANLASPRDGERVFRLTRGGYGEAISSATSDRIPHTPSSKGMFPLSGGLIGARCARAASEP